MCDAREMGKCDKKRVRERVTKAKGSGLPRMMWVGNPTSHNCGLSSTHNCGLYYLPHTSTDYLLLSLMKTQENIQQFCVQVRMVDVEVKHFKVGVDDWDIIGQCTSSLMTVTVVVKQSEGDQYPTSGLVLSFMNSFMRTFRGYSY